MARGCRMVATASKRDPRPPGCSGALSGALWVPQLAAGAAFGSRFLEASVFHRFWTPFGLALTGKISDSV